MPYALARSLLPDPEQTFYGFSIQSAKQLSLSHQSFELSYVLIKPSRVTGLAQEGHSSSGDTKNLFYRHVPEAHAQVSFGRRRHWHRFPPGSYAVGL